MILTSVDCTGSDLSLISLEHTFQFAQRLKAFPSGMQVLYRNAAKKRWSLF